MKKKERKGADMEKQIKIYGKGMILIKVEDRKWKTDFPFDERVFEGDKKEVIDFFKQQGYQTLILQEGKRETVRYM
jgi:hypothetical protein